MRRTTVLLTAAGAGLSLLLGMQVPANAADPRGPSSATARADTWVVSVGDSYISGEAGRWAGNTNDSPNRTDALGEQAYWDTATGESIPRCHRSKSAEIHIGSGVQSKNLACSGAETATMTNSDGNFKPGLDFYNQSGQVGQAKALQDFAKNHPVKMVVLSIGGNDFDFGSIVQTCIVDFLTSSSLFPKYCSEDADVLKNFTPANVATVTDHIAGGIRHIHTAMANAGYADTAYTILVQTYPAPIPAGAGFRYSESGFTRQTTGGCGFWNKDANWTTETVLPTVNGAVRKAVTQTGLKNTKILNLGQALAGRRLCENTVGLLEEKDVSSWRNPGAADRTEWVAQVHTLSTVTGPYFVQESLHPNHWGQLALRNCVRHAWNGGTVRGGTCTIAGTGLNANGEPKMALN